MSYGRWDGTCSLLALLVCDRTISWPGIASAVFWVPPAMGFLILFQGGASTDETVAHTRADWSKKALCPPGVKAWCKPVWQLMELCFFLKKQRTSLVVQWLRVVLSMQVTQVRSLAREDPTGLWATEPEGHNYWAPWATKEATAMRSPDTTTRESPHAAMKTK